MSELQQVNDTLESITSIDDGSEQYLSFLLGDEEYGVEILRVQEIKGWDQVTHIPNSPHYLCGVLNLRGTIVPIVDLRLRFDMPPREYTPTTVVVVLKVEGVTQRTVGIVVDGVSDAHNIVSEDIKPTPDFGSCVSTEFITGLVSLGDNMMMILNVDRLLSVEALG
ncbi:MAG: chemotaxis protein CheW [Methylophaga sp.]|nr:chemotaxis protein CheW [Methylophaga sp.]